MATLAQGAVGRAERLSGPRPIELDDIRNKPIAGKKQHWGYHLLLDISGCNKAIDDETKVKAFLMELVTALKMKTIGPPVVVKVDGEDGRGLTAIQIITTSSITFHGDNDKWSVYLDVFSCKTYEPKTALALVKKHFKPKHIGSLWVERDAGRWPEK